MKLEQLKKRVIGYLLHMANSRPPFLRKYEFYRLKDRLLHQYGQGDGFDIQHIIKHCYACDGSGQRTYPYLGNMFYQRKCDRCAGSGVYEEMWVRLERWTLGGYSFHIPRERNHRYPDGTNLQHPVIEGYINHKAPRFYFHEEAALWLALVFDRRLFISLFGHTGYVSTKFTPLVIASSALFWIQHTPACFFRRLKLWFKYDLPEWWRAQFVSKGQETNQEVDEYPF